MRNLVLCLASVAAAATPAIAAPRESVPMDAAAAKVLAARTAGPPQDCIPLVPSHPSRIIGTGTILYEAGASRWFVNRPDDGQCTQLRPGRAIAVRVPTTQLCRGDILTIFDPQVHFEYGSCGLGDFVPYDRPAR